MDKISLGKYCINCKYSVWCNNRLLCIKHGKTTENDDYCHDIIEREIIVIQEVNLYDTTKISMDEMASEVESVDLSPHMPVMPLEK